MVNYLDHNATTPVHAKVLQALPEFLALPYNASSVHQLGRKAKHLLEQARKQVVAACGAEAAQVVFTASGTEANNWVLHHAQGAEHVAVLVTEHSSVLAPAAQRHATHIPVDENGVIKLEALERILAVTPGKTLVSVQLANNETGVIQPVAEVVKIVLQHGGFVHTDASQALGKIPLNFEALNVDFMTVSAHKCGGIAGAGALIMKKGLKITPLFVGGGQEVGYRAGTENIPAIAVFGLAASLAQPQRNALQTYLEQQIQAVSAQAIIAGQGADRLPNTSYILTPGMSNETQLIHYDMAGIAVSAGSACSSGKISASHVLKAMGYSDTLASSSIRVSTGPNSTQQDIDHFLSVWQKIAQKCGIIEEQKKVA